MEVDDEVVHGTTSQQQQQGFTTQVPFTSVGEVAVDGIETTESTTTTTTTTTATTNIRTGRASDDTDPLTSTTTTTAISYSPLGMALAPPASALQTFLPDPSGVYHYHRPPIVSLSMEPRLSREVERIRTLARALGARRMTHSGRVTEHDVRQAALERVVRRLTMTMRSDSFGRQAISDQYRLALSSSRHHQQTKAAKSSSREKPTSSQITEAEDDDQWVSEDGLDSGEDSADVLAREALDMARRANHRAERRRIGGGGISKGSSHGRRAAGSLTAAYTRHMTDEQAVRRTVTEMGQGDPDTILRLLRTGVSANIKDSVGRTPLHVACSCANGEAVRLLLHMGADANSVDRVGNTPLTIAATAALIDLVVPLLEAGADPQIGKGMVSAMAMVRSRLRLLRAHIRHARAAEMIAAEPTAARARRLHAVAVARQCVDIIHLLRLHSSNSPRPPFTAPEAAARVASSSDQNSSHSAVMTPEASTELDALSSQLLSLGLDNNSTQESGSSSADKGKEYAYSPRAATTTNSDDGDNNEDDRIDGLLEKFSRLLGDNESE